MKGRSFPDTALRGSTAADRPQSRAGNTDTGAGTGAHTASDGPSSPRGCGGAADGWRSPGAAAGSAGRPSNTVNRTRRQTSRPKHR